MKKSSTFLLIMIALCVNYTATAQSLQAYFSNATFSIPGEEPYLETYVEIIGNTIKYKATGENKFQGNVQIALIIKQDSVIKDFRKYELKSPEINDTTNVALNFIDQQRFMLENGNYNIELSIVDLNHPNPKSAFITYPVIVDFPDDKISVSSIQLVKELSKSTETTVMSKSGYDIIPYVDNFYGPSMDKLTFYTEIYNPKAEANAGERYLISSFIESFESRQMLNNYIRIKREDAKPVSVVLNEFNIADLPSGNYNLVVSVRDKNNTMITQQVNFFQKLNGQPKSQSSIVQGVNVENTFASRLNDPEVLREYIRSLRPVSTQSEKMFINTYVQTAELIPLQQFFYNFWQDRNPEQPEQAWINYNNEVIKVNNSYSTQIKKGYDTEMGRVYLQYGPPNTVTDRPFDTGGLLNVPSVPYQIWHYYTLNNNRERNKKFVFIASELNVKDYTLVHSDATGEIQNFDWQSQLRRQKGTNETDADDLRRDRGRSGTYYNNPF